MINDGDGVAVISHSTSVEQFLASQDLPSKELDMKRIGSPLGSAAGVARPDGTVGERIVIQARDLTETQQQREKRQRN